MPLEDDPTSTSLPPVPPPAEPGDVELVACPACGASNAARRRRCGRCGKLIATPGDAGEDSDQHLVVPPPGPAADREEPAVSEEAGPPRARRARRRGLGVLVVGLGLVLGTGLGVAAGTGIGPFATVEPVPFDATAYPRDPAAIRPATTGSSSTAPSAGDRQFGPRVTVDGDLTTAWMPDGEATGARLRHGFVAPVWVARLEVATGDQHDEGTFGATARVTQVRVDLGPQVVKIDLQDVDGVQLVVLPEPVLTDQATWEVTDTTGGVGAITEVRYVGWPADEADREAFRARG